MTRAIALFLLIAVLPLSAASDTAEQPLRRHEKDIVLIHGLGATAAIWDDVAPLLGLGFNVWSFELPGHGNTQPVGDVSIERVAMLLEDYVVEHDIRFPVVVGHGLGGLVALRYSFDRPDEVDRIVLIDAAPRQLASDEQKAVIAEQIMTNYDRFVAGYYLNMSPKEKVNDKVVDMALRTDKISFQQLLLSSFDFDVVDELSYQSIPLLVIGSGMMFPDPTHARDMMNQMGFAAARSVNFKTMPQQGHYVMLEQAGYLASIILAFSGLAQR